MIAQGLAAAAIVLSAPVPAPAASAQTDGMPAIAGFGRTFAAPRAAMQPDFSVRYKVVFSITRAAATPDETDPSLDKVARFLNLLAANHVHPQPGDIVAIVHGAATPIVVDNADYARKTGAKANPNLALITRLRAAGVTVAVCDQALEGSGFAATAVAPGVRVDLSALTTLATLQLRGWALIPD